MKRIFYVLYLPDRTVTDCVDAIRFLLNPLEKQSAHVTVRGPYSSPIPHPSLSTINERLKGNRLSINGIGRFEGPNQHTVFFNCDGTHLRQVWKKRDFEYHPHLTLYDGKDATIAERLSQIASTYAFNLSFLSDRLAEMASIKGQMNLALRASFRSQLVEFITGQQIDVQTVPSLHIDCRLKLVDGLLGWLSCYSERAGNAAAQVCTVTPDSPSCWENAAHLVPAIS